MALRLELKLVDDMGRTHGAVSRNISDEVAFCGERAAEDFRLGAFMTTAEPVMDQAVKVLKKREFRKDLLISAGADIAHQLADFLADREGWHGLDRQEGCERIIKRIQELTLAAAPKAPNAGRPFQVEESIKWLEAISKDPLWDKKNLSFSIKQVLDYIAALEAPERK